MILCTANDNMIASGCVVHSVHGYGEGTAGQCEHIQGVIQNDSSLSGPPVPAVPILVQQQCVVSVAPCLCRPHSAVHAAADAGAVPA